MLFGSSGNGLYLEALQGSQSLIVGGHPWVTPIVSDSSDSSYREDVGLGVPGLRFPWLSSPAVPAPGGQVSLGLNRSGSSENRESAVLEQS